MMTEEPGGAQEKEEGAKKVETGIEGDIRSALRSVKDPEIDMNVVDLGLIYGIELIEGKAYVEMTLTSPGCPAGPEIVADVERAAGAVDGVDSVGVEIVWEPFWSPDRMDPRVRAFLGM